MKNRPIQATEPAIEIGIVGNPNSGKTTLFNLLTGSRQRVGNWPGVTVEQKIGHFCYKHHDVKLVDLPGTYSLVVASEEHSIDERVACDYMASGQAKVIINVIDASNLERNLYLTMQLLERGVPVIVALNMIDVARKKNIHIDHVKLAKYLGCPVVPLEAVKKRGITELKNTVIEQASAADTTQVLAPFAYSAAIERAIDDLIQRFYLDITRTEARTKVIALFESDARQLAAASPELISAVRYWQEQLLLHLKQETDILFADARYDFIGSLCANVAKRVSGQRHQVTQWVDNIVLNRFLGIPIFLVIMYAMFLFAINLGGVFQDFFDIGSDALFVQAPAQVLQHYQVPSWLIMLVTEGIGRGLNTVVTFIPVIFGMFFFLAFLEQVGYMARAAFVVDRLMRAIGLPGKSFVPMIVGFGCNVPAVMAARTLDNKRDRVLTALMSPFMSCGARLAIFAVFCAAFFPTGGAFVVFTLYFIGIIVAVLTGLLLRKTILQGDAAPFVLELPIYHVPTLKSLWFHTWHRLRAFVLKAGRLIIPICILLGILNTISVSHAGWQLILTNPNESRSLLAVFGQVLTPIFAPFGITSDNWPATVGLLSGVLAKEVVVGSLNSLYSQAAHLLAAPVTSFHLGASLMEALRSIPANIVGLGAALWNPIAASAPDSGMANNVMGVMYQRFDGQVGAFAYLLFVLLYFPCVSTTAAMARELGKAWAWFSTLWTTAVAYSFAVGFYQLFTIARHPVSAIAWLVGICLFYVLTFIGLRWFSLKDLAAQANKPSHTGSPNAGGAAGPKAVFCKKCGL